MKKTTSLIVILILVLSVMPLISVKPVFASPMLQEYQMQVNSQCSCYDPYRRAQSFTVNATSHTLTSIKLMLYRLGTPNTCYLEIRACNSSGYPTGGNLATSSLNGNTFTTSTDGAWYEFTLNIEIVLDANTKYAIQIHTAGSSANYVAWKYKTGNVFNGDCFYTLDSATYLIDPANYDFCFQNFGNPLVIYVATIYYTSGVSVVRLNGSSYGNGTSWNLGINQNETVTFEVLGLHDFAFENWTYDGSVSSTNPFSLVFDTNYTVWCFLYNLTEYYGLGYTQGYADGFGNATGEPFIYARFTMNDSAPYQNQDTVFFNASLSNCSSLPLAYYWEFGDSSTSTGETTTHIYLSSGVFIVNLTVVNGSMSDSMFQNITVFATSINITFDWNDLLFGSGAWLPFIAIMIAMFVGVAINKWFVVAALPIMALMSFLYFDHITTTPSLVWEALIMMCSAIVLLLYSASKK